MLRAENEAFSIFRPLCSPKRYFSEIVFFHGESATAIHVVPTGLFGDTTIRACYTVMCN